MNNIPWMKLYYSLLDWEWIRCPEMVCLWINLLLRASNTTRRENGMTIRRGQVVTSRSQLAKQCGISEQSVRTCITRLISTKQITIESTKPRTIITICKFDKYQQKGPTKQQSSQPSSQPTSNQRATNEQPTRQIIPISPSLNEKGKHNKSERINACAGCARAKKTGQFDFLGALLEVGVDESVASDWMLVRAKTGAVNSATAFRSVAGQIERCRADFGATPTDCITMAATNSWRGFKYSWFKNEKAKENGRFSSNRREDIPFDEPDHYGPGTI